jgi:hypothetical protein
MINWKVRSELNKKLIVFSFAAVLFTGCSKDEPDKDVVARVNDSYLSGENFTKLSDTAVNPNFYREEIIRNWINSELLYQEAVREGITKRDEYANIIKESERELAVSLYIKAYFEENPVTVDQKEATEFYDANMDDFRLSYPAIFINNIRFDNDDKAALFRITAVESGWPRALSVFKGDPSIVKEETGKFIYEHDLRPLILYRLVKELYPQEISIILQDQENFILVQVLEKYPEGTIPPQDIIKDDVIKRVAAVKKERILREHINELYSKNQIEVRRN